MTNSYLTTKTMLHAREQDRFTSKCKTPQNGSGTDSHHLRRQKMNACIRPTLGESAAVEA